MRLSSSKSSGVYRRSGLGMPIGIAGAADGPLAPWALREADLLGQVRRERVDLLRGEWIVHRSGSLEWVVRGVERGEWARVGLGSERHLPRCGFAL
jgi:hypothetical protein